ncbi:unnamed protein product [Cuscuta epithymum]|uniref:Bifunctional inhibitor/plant lipid transfer protein/seed storage helical domain-containing protein n=1 Tax=Cuscuta epithymum TaxID=186058 RepID=A0AAV0G427_9ASTE|nr:unnamed protein product [Cuscuta epithymum]CAH9142540.1 unnamed protein product [Cuscuta epithymum]
MASKFVPFFFFMVLLAGLASSDVSKDKAECAEQLVGIATCLPYVSDEARTPPRDCCAGLKGVIEKSKKCICILVKDRNDASLGLKINSTRALGLPDLCQTPANVSQCVQLLNLAPNSPDAKVFQDFVNSAKGSGATTAPVKGSSGDGATGAEVKSDGSKRKQFLEANVVAGLIFYVFNYFLNF